jgi:hypothetical protein
MATKTSKDNSIYFNSIALRKSHTSRIIIKKNLPVVFAASSAPPTGFDGRDGVQKEIDSTEVNDDRKRAHPMPSHLQTATHTSTSWH